MRFLLIMLFLTGCSSSPKPKELIWYDCRIFVKQYMEMQIVGYWPNYNEAKMDTEKVRDRLVAIGILPMDARTACYQSWKD